MADTANTPARAEQLRSHLRWVLFARVVIVSCFLGAVAFTHVVRSGGRFAIPIEWLVDTIAITYALTIVCGILLGRLRHLSAFTYVQIAIDVVLVSCVIVFTGGADSPFPFLYSLTIFAAAILLQSTGAAVASILTVGAYSALVAAHVYGVIPQSTYPLPPPPMDAQLLARLLINGASFFILAYLAGVLTARLHQTELMLAVEQTAHGRLERLQETLARHIGCGLVTTDVDGRISSVNTTAVQLCGHPESALLGNDLGSIFPPLHLSGVNRATFLQSSCATPVEFQHTLAEGKELSLRCAVAPLQNTYDHPIGALYIIQDVTSLHQLEEKYREEGEAAAEFARAGEAPDADDDSCIDGFVGRSPAMQQVRSLIDKVAPSDATVLLCGESGTGKEVAARAVHAKSGRRDRPFIAVNCGAIPETLIESELFGHVKGAFTGAVTNRAGMFRMADGGTVFLDEIGDLPLQLQVKLLRVLQERVFMPVGGESNVAVNVRVIAASNRNLGEAVRKGRFREDLFYRLNVISVELPPLRERTADIPLLIRHFLREFSELHRKRVVRLSVAAGRRLVGYRFPGNVRELANIIEHAVTMVDGETVHETHLPDHILLPPRSAPQPPPVEPAPEPIESPAARHEMPAPPHHTGNGRIWSGNLDSHLEEYEKAILVKALDEASGVRRRAAEILGINYRSLRHRLSKYGLNGGDVADIHDN